MTSPNIGSQPKERWWEYLRRVWRSHSYHFYNVLYRLHLKRRPTLEEAKAKAIERLKRLERKHRGRR